MKKLAQISFIALALLCILGIAAYLLFQSQENERQRIESILEQAIQKNRTGEVDLVDLSLLFPFSWDKLYVFRPYAPPEYIDTVLGKYWIGSRFTQIESSDRITLLVFTKNGEVVQYLEFSRNYGDFDPAPNESGYPISFAKFVVDKGGQMIWLFANK